MKMMRVVLFVALGAMLVVACGCDRGVRLTGDDSGGSVTVPAGETFEVVLESNPTTGYSWGAVEIPDCVEQEGESEYESDAPPTMMGAGGEETWRFTAVEPGEGTLLLEYRRPWEEEPDVAGTFEIEVVVE